MLGVAGGGGKGQEPLNAVGLWVVRGKNICSALRVYVEGSKMK